MGILTARVSKSICVMPQTCFKSASKHHLKAQGLGWDRGAPRFGAHPLLTSQALPSGLREGSHGAALDQAGCQKYSQKSAFPMEWVHCCDPSSSPGRRGNTGLRARTAPGCPPSLQHPSPRSVSVLLPDCSPEQDSWGFHSPVRSGTGPARLRGHPGS